MSEPTDADRKAEWEAKMARFQLGLQKDMIRSLGCPVCGVKHRNGLTCKPLKFGGLQDLITTKKPKPS